MPFNIGGYIYNGGQADTQDYYNIITRGLISHLDASAPSSYPGSGTIWADLSSVTNNGTLTNGPTFNGGNGGYIDFDGTNDRIELGSIPNMTTDATFCAWVNGATLSGDRAIMSIKDVLIQLAPDGIVYWFDVDTNNLLFSGVYSTDTWYYIVVAQSGTSISAYKNGTFVQTQTGGNIGSSYSNKQIGAYFGARNWYGRIGAIQIYNRQLSAAEVLQNFNVQRSRFGV
jgi:hypothetical protein